MCDVCLRINSNIIECCLIRLSSGYDSKSRRNKVIILQSSFFFRDNLLVLEKYPNMESKIFNFWGLSDILTIKNSTKSDYMIAFSSNGVKSRSLINVYTSIFCWYLYLSRLSTTYIILIMTLPSWICSVWHFLYSSENRRESISCELNS